MKKLILIICLLLFIMPVSANAKINVHLFYSESCPHCHDEIDFLKEYQLENDQFEIILYEVSEKDNEKLMMDAKKAFQNNDSYVPFTVIGLKSFTGFNTNIKEELKLTINYYLENEYRDLVSEIEAGTFLPGIHQFTPDIIENEKITIPVIGEIDPKNYSLPIIAITIGFIDGMNPCAMWVLLFLIGMLIPMQNRFRMWVLGMTFLVTSALVYTILMVGWLSIAVSITQINAFRIIIATFSLIAGGYSLTKYIQSLKKDTGCQVVSKDQRNKIYEKIKAITSQKNMLLAIVGVIILSATVNVVELACSAGLPLMFTQILAVNNLTTPLYALYIGLYMLFFLINEIIVFTVAMITLKRIGFSNKLSHYSNLLGGIIMIILGLLLIFRPDILMFA